MDTQISILIKKFCKIPNVQLKYQNEIFMLMFV